MINGLLLVDSHRPTYPVEEETFINEAGIATPL